MTWHKILVPVGGRRTDEAVIGLACSLARESKAKVRVIYVVEVAPALPLDAQLEADIEQGWRILDGAERCAEDNDYEVETELLQAREAGPAILDEAEERGADLILMGMDYKRRFGEFSLGHKVPYVLKNAPCAVFLYREPFS
ncbi:MAG: universal stress protein [Dehalococcoidia bacterium]